MATANVPGFMQTASGLSVPAAPGLIVPGGCETGTTSHPFADNYIKLRQDVTDRENTLTMILNKACLAAQESTCDDQGGTHYGTLDSKLGQKKAGDAYSAAIRADLVAKYKNVDFDDPVTFAEYEIMRVGITTDDVIGYIATAGKSFSFNGLLTNAQIKPQLEHKMRKLWQTVMGSLNDPDAARDVLSYLKENGHNGIENWVNLDQIDAQASMDLMERHLGGARIMDNSPESWLFKQPYAKKL